MNRTLTLVVCVFMFMCAPAFAILGIGDIVFDPTSYGELIQQLLQMEQQYAQLVQTYQTIRGQYDHMLRMAQQVPVNMAARYRVAPTPWLSTSATDTYGTTGGWVAGINTGYDVTSGYEGATQHLDVYGATAGNIPADQLQHIKTDYATVELADGANLSAIQTIGRLRANTTATETAIQNLENDSLASDPTMNTEIAVLNKISAAHIVSVRSDQDTNKLLAALAEMQIVSAKRQRDAEARAINSHVRFMTEGRAAMTAQASGASAAMLAWRMP